jgi:ATP-dependent Clp protease adapter protein ClpS
VSRGARDESHQSARSRVHTTGASVVATAPRERAEHMGTELARFGLRVTVEPDS